MRERVCGVLMNGNVFNPSLPGVIPLFSILSPILLQSEINRIPIESTFLNFFSSIFSQSQYLFFRLTFLLLLFPKITTRFLFETTLYSNTSYSQNQKIMFVFSQKNPLAPTFSSMFLTSTMFLLITAMPIAHANRNCDINGPYKVQYLNKMNQWQPLCVHGHHDTDNERCHHPWEHSEQHNAYVSISPRRVEEESPFPAEGMDIEYPLRMKVTLKGVSKAEGIIRPRHMAEDGGDEPENKGLPTYKWIRNTLEDGGAAMEFVVNRPAQLSIEIDDEYKWMPTTGSNANLDYVRKLYPLLVFANPAVTVATSSTTRINIANDIEIAKLVSKDLDFKSPVINQPVMVPENHILRIDTQEQADLLYKNCAFLPGPKAPMCTDGTFEISIPNPPDSGFTPVLVGGGGKTKTVLVDGGFGNTTRTIKLGKNAGLYIGSDVVLRAMIQSKEEGAFVYGYGTITTTTRFNSEYPTGDGTAIVQLEGRDSWINGPVLLDSAYRNIAINTGGVVRWTKSMTGCGETDGVGSPDGNSTNITVTDSFFRVHDDVIKMYYNNSFYKNLTIWHTAQGRALMYSWGNEGESQNLTNVTAENIYVIHDEQYYSWRGEYAPQWYESQNTQYATGYLTGTEAAKYSSNNAYYSSIIGLYKQTQNQMKGMTIKGLHLESVVGMVMNVFNGFARPTCMKDPIDWFKPDICAGDVSFNVTDVSTKYMTAVAMGSSITGCEKNFTGENYVEGCPMTCGCDASINCGDVNGHNQCRASVTLAYKEKPACDHRCIDLGIGPRGSRSIINGCDC